MPRATVTTEAIRVPLKSAPPDGYIKVKQLAHGQKLHRIDISAKMSIQQKARDTRGSLGVEEDEATKNEFEMFQLRARQFEYSRMIVEHNLEDNNGKLLDFNNILTFDILAPQVGEEIDAILDDMNAGKVKQEDFQEPAGQSSTGAGITSKTSPSGN